MKTTFLTCLFFLTVGIANAQVGTSTLTTPNSGSDNSVPPMNTTPLPNTLSTPNNSTVPGANGSYSINTGSPDINNPNGLRTNTPQPRTPGTTTITPPTGTYPQGTSPSGTYPPGTTPRK